MVPLRMRLMLLLSSLLLLVLLLLPLRWMPLPLQAVGMSVLMALSSFLFARRIARMNAGYMRGRSMMEEERKINTRCCCLLLLYAYNPLCDSAKKREKGRRVTRKRVP